MLTNTTSDYKPTNRLRRYIHTYLCVSFDPLYIEKGTSWQTWDLWYFICVDYIRLQIAMECDLVNVIYIRIKFATWFFIFCVLLPSSTSPCFSFSLFVFWVAWVLSFILCLSYNSIKIFFLCLCIEILWILCEFIDHIWVLDLNKKNVWIHRANRFAKIFKFTHIFSLAHTIWLLVEKIKVRTAHKCIQMRICLREILLMNRVNSQMNDIIRRAT